MENKNQNNSIQSMHNLYNDNLGEERDNSMQIRSKVVQNSIRNQKKTQYSPNYIITNTYDEQNSIFPKKKKDADLPSANIVPGYKNFILDENNAAYDSIADMFSKEEIDQAFKILDYQGNNEITTEELTFFLESIGEQARPEEIEEMIKMCDLEGKGYVTKEEFVKLASGQSLAPIGQAYPPTEEMLRKKELLDNFKMEDLQSQKFRHSVLANPKVQKKNQQVTTTALSATLKANETNFFNPQNVEITQKGLRNNLSSVGTGDLNTKANKLTPITTNKSTAQVPVSLGTSIQQKKETANKIKNFGRWLKENKIGIDRLIQMIKSLNEYQKGEGNERDANDIYKDYQEFLKFFGVQDSEQQQTHQEIFKLAQSGSSEVNRVNLLEFLFALIASLEIPSNSKYDLAFQLMGKDTISLEDLFYIERRLTLSEKIPEDKIRNKFINQKNKIEYKAKPLANDEMDKQFFLDFISSYPTCFQG